MRMHRPEKQTNSVTEWLCGSGNERKEKEKGNAC